MDIKHLYTLIPQEFTEEIKVLSIEPDEVPVFIGAILPDQTGNSGKFLQTNGSTLLWAAAGGGGSQNLSSVLTVGNDAGNQSMINIKSLDLVEQLVAPSPAVNQIALHAMDSQGITVLQAVDNGGFMYELGEDTYFIARNTTASIITKGKCVYVNGATGVTPNIALAKADSLATVTVAGVAAEDIAINGFGRVFISGVIENINTNSYNVGDILYVSPTTAGSYTTTYPSNPNYAKKIGDVIVKGVGNGKILIRVAATFGRETGTNNNFTAPVLNASTGFQVNGAASANTYLTGNGTNYVASAFTFSLAGNLATTGAFNTTFAQQFSGTITLPNNTSTLMTLGLNESVTGVKTFSQASILINNPAATFAYTIQSAAITAARTLNLPLITGSDTLAVLGLAQTFATGVKTFNNTILAIRNPANTFSYTIAASAITANRTLSLPLLTSNDTIVTIKRSLNQLGKLIGADLNSTSDQSITLSGGITYVITDVVICNNSTDLSTFTTADGELWDTAGRAGNQIMQSNLSTELFTILDGSGLKVLNQYSAQYANTSAIGLLLSPPSLVATNTIYFSLANAFGSAAACDIYVYGYVLN